MGPFRLKIRHDITIFLICLGRLRPTVFVVAVDRFHAGASCSTFLPVSAAAYEDDIHQGEISLLPVLILVH